MNSSFLTLSKPLSTLPFLSHPRRHHLLRRQTTTNSNNDTSSPPPQPPETAKIRFKRGSRRRSKQKQQDDESSNGFSKKDQKNAPKEWESMTLSEKAIELYVGEKGLLFWLNKFAYASIYVIIGAWILFRFVGPALNLYQLDSGPLSPSAILKG